MTDDTPFTQTPLFQLNLMLWLSWSSATQQATGIRPVFYEAGFRLHAIAPSLGISLKNGALATQYGLVLQATAAPELLLRNDSKQVLVPLECKLNSFSASSDTAKQALTLLSISGEEIADRIGLSAPTGWDAHLYYAVKGGSQDAMYETLLQLSSQLTSSTIASNNCSVIGIGIQDDGIYLDAVPRDGGPIETLYADSSNNGAHIKVMEVAEGESPSILLLIPIDPSIDINDRIGQTALCERIRASVVSLIGSQLDKPDFAITEDEIMTFAIEVWELWKDRKSTSGLLKNIVRPYMRQVIDSIQSFGVTVTRSEGRLTFAGINPEVAGKVRRYFASRAFMSGDIAPSGGQLRFDDIFDEWNS